MCIVHINMLHTQHHTGYRPVLVTGQPKQQLVLFLQLQKQLLVLHKHLLLQLGQELASPLPLPGLRDHVQQAKQLLHLVVIDMKR